MRRSIRQNEQGAVEVEATIILPLAILSIVFLLYLSLFLFQRANLQTVLETSLVYYKNPVTDTYVTRNSEVVYSITDESNIGVGNSYEVTGPLNPYRGMFGNAASVGSEADFEKYFDSIAGKMLFDDDLSLTFSYRNHLVADEFEVTALQKVSFPIDLSLIGVGKEYEISATARVAVVDHDMLIRNVDYAVDLLEDTKLGEYATQIAGKVTDAYNRMKEVLGG